MSQHEKYEVVEKTSIHEITGIEALCDWAKSNWKILAIGAAMFIHTMIFIGIIVTVSSMVSSDNTMSEWAMIPSSDMEITSVEVPITTSEELMKKPEMHVEVGVSVEESIKEAAYEMGMNTGELLIISKDALLDFCQGFDEATGASGWAKDLWDIGKDQVTEWLEGNIDSYEETDFASHDSRTINPEIIAD